MSNQIKYFKTEINYGWRKGEGNDQDSPRHQVVCKAVQDEDTWTVSIVCPEVKNPYILLMKDVLDSFFNGVEEIQPSFYNAQHDFVSNLTK